MVSLISKLSKHTITNTNIIWALLRKYPSAHPHILGYESPCAWGMSLSFQGSQALEMALWFLGIPPAFSSFWTP